MNWYQQIAAQMAQAALDFIEADASTLEKDLAPFVTEGETAVVAAATKLNPLLGAAVSLAVDTLGNEVPAFEGDAVKWVEAVLEAFIAKMQGT